MIVSRALRIKYSVAICPSLELQSFSATAVLNRGDQAEPGFHDDLDHSGHVNNWLNRWRKGTME